MENKLKKLTSTQCGFIQIPMIIVFLMLGTVATSAGSYYAVQHSKKQEIVKVPELSTVFDRKINLEEIHEIKAVGVVKGKVSLNSSQAKAEKVESQCLMAAKLNLDTDTMGLGEYCKNYPKKYPEATGTEIKELENSCLGLRKEYLINKYKKEEKECSEQQEQKQDNPNVEKAEKFIDQLGTIREDVEILRKAGGEVKAKIISTETVISDTRIEKLEQLAASAPSETIVIIYRQLVSIEEIRKKGLGFNLADYWPGVHVYSSEIGGVIKLLKNGDFENGLPKAQILVDAHSERFDKMKEQAAFAVENAIAKDKEYAQEFLARMENTGALSRSYASAVQALEEVSQARKDIEKITTDVTYEGYFVPSSQVVSQTQNSASVSSCKYPTSKYVLVPGKGWTAVMQCENGTYIEADKYVPDISNMTQQQICDMRKAARISGGAYISDSQPDPACK